MIRRMAKHGTYHAPGPEATPRVGPHVQADMLKATAYGSEADGCRLRVDTEGARVIIDARWGGLYEGGIFEPLCSPGKGSHRKVGVQPERSA